MPPRLVLAVALAATAAGWAALARPASHQPAAAAPTDPLAGTWELVSVIEDGRLVPMDLVRQTMIRDARVWVQGGFLAFTRPDGSGRTLPVTVDLRANPHTIDLVGAQTFGGQGIFVRDGDTLLICLNGSASGPRPTSLASLPGSHAVLMTCQRVPQAAPPPAAAPPEQPPAPQATPDQNLRESLIGTWGHQTDDRIVKITLNPDGTFSNVLEWKRGFKKVFGSDERASGTWRVKDGMAIFSTTAATDRRQVGQVASYRITQVSAGEVIYVDNQTGARRIEWKLR